ncbi:hypothetical protein ACIQZG_22170 [Lysinibacillus sp. NPDC096418]|uniref:hypothetical protein n=1 Tax=Lysinibacillus sp. NPDC096418 TaxID=3364138 RepID=UPI0037F6EB04
MNTVFVVKNCAYQFMVAPEEVKFDWVNKILNTENMESFHLDKDLYVLNTTNKEQKFTYRIRFGENMKEIEGDFMLAKKENNSFLPLSEQLEDFIIDNVEITRI